MFSKILLFLFLAVYFKALRTEAQANIDEEIHGGLQLGKALQVHKNNAKMLRIVIKAELGSIVKGDGDIGLFFFYDNFEGRIITNYRVNGTWGKDKSYSRNKNVRADIEIVVEQDFFVITFNGRQYYINQMVSIQGLKYWQLETDAREDLEYKWYRQFAPFTCQST